MKFSVDEPQDILRKYIEGMPTFSPATAKIIQLANKLNCPPNEIVAAIRLDPVLTGKVLQLVNSAYFSLAQKVTSLNRAVVYLGINTIKNLALSTAVMQAFDTKNKELAELIRPAWKHSLATAVCAKSIAKAADVPTNMLEEYFIAGLLHDVGLIIMIQAFYDTIPHSGVMSLSEERASYGVDHSDVGRDTLKRWKFSDELVEAIATYHMPIPTNKMSHFLHIADGMTYRLQLNGEEEGSVPRLRAIHPGSYAAIGITEAKVLAELESAADMIQKAEVFLNISSSTEKVVESG